MVWWNWSPPWRVTACGAGRALWSGAVLGVALAIVGAGSGVAMAIEPSAIAESWQRDRSQIETQAQLAWVLETGDAVELATGAPVVRPLQQSEELVTVGMIWLDYPRDEVWIAIHDRDDRPLSQGDLVYQTLRDQPGAWRTSHALLDLPWPLKDRQWVSLVRVSWPLLEATDGRVLERWVELGPPGLADAPDPDAQWLEELHGGWLLMEVGGGTLALFSARTPSVGPLPPDIVQPWVTKTVTGSLQQLRTNLGELRQHYRGSHLPLPGPRGEALPLYP